MISIVNAPQINANDDQVGVVAWHVEDGGYVALGDDLLDLETSKATVTIPADIEGYVRRLVVKGAIVQVGAALCQIATSAEEAIEEPVLQAPPVRDLPPPAAVTAPPAPVSPDRPARAATVAGALQPGTAPARFSRAAADLIAALGLDPQTFAGKGLVTARSIQAARMPAQSTQVSAGIVPAAVALQPVPVAGRDESLSLAKRAEIEALSTGESGLINSTLTVQFDSDALRARLARDGTFDGNVQPIILYEVSRLLLKWPQFTAFYDDGAIHFYDRVDLGVALDLGRGLKVVTLREANTLMPIELFERTIAFALAYNDNKIAPADLIGSTFTVTDLSGLDVLHFKPLINGRQSAILGIGGDAEQSGHPMTLNLTFDHRVANGREAALFLRELRARLTSYTPAATLRAGRAAPDSAHGPALPVLAADGAVQCGRCGIGLDEYRRIAGANAYLFACVSDNGTIEPFCHRCTGGFF